MGLSSGQMVDRMGVGMRERWRLVQFLKLPHLSYSKIELVSASPKQNISWWKDHTAL